MRKNFSDTLCNIGLIKQNVVLRQLNYVFNMPDYSRRYNIISDFMPLLKIKWWKLCLIRAYRIQGTINTSATPCPGWSRELDRQPPPRTTISTSPESSIAPTSLTFLLGIMEPEEMEPVEMVESFDYSKIDPSQMTNPYDCLWYTAEKAQKDKEEQAKRTVEADPVTAFIEFQLP
jgi:hypothetical protein